MNNRRKLVIALGAGAFTPLASYGQLPGTKLARIGFLGVGSASFTASRVEALRAGLRDLGYIEGKNIVFEQRYADGKDDRLADLAAELVRLKVDVLVSHTTPGVRAAMQANSTIPVVIAATGDAVATGLIASLARPGGIVTGSTILTPEYMAKRIELLKEIAPGIKRVAALLRSSAAVIPILRAMGNSAKSLRIEVRKFDAPTFNGLNDSFSAMTKSHVNGLVAQDDPTIIGYAKAIAGYAEKQRIPTIGSSECAEAGMLLGYGVDIPEMFRRAANYVDKILKGVKPGDIPVEQPTKFEMVINMKTAKALGFKISNSILVQATKVIE